VGLGSFAIINDLLVREDVAVKIEDRIAKVEGRAAKMDDVAAKMDNVLP
jgi:hypothetical protein